MGNQEIKTVTMELSETQAKIIQTALEEWFRIRIGQFSDLAEDLVFSDYKKDPKHPEKFDVCLQARDDLNAIFDAAKRIAWPNGVTKNKSPVQVQIAEDVWSTLRHELYIANGGDPNSWCVDARPPLQLGAEPLPKIKIYMRGND